VAIKAGEIVDWLKEDLDLGRGYAMAIYTLLKGREDAGKGTREKLKS
jgi:hypothetical protein